MTKPTRSATKPTDEKIEMELPPIEPPPIEASANLPASQQKIDEFVRRRTEVTEQDHAEFQEYLRLKEEENARKGAVVPAAEVEEKRKSRISRRTMLNVAVGTAGVAEGGFLREEDGGPGWGPAHGAPPARRDERGAGQ